MKKFEFEFNKKEAILDLTNTLKSKWTYIIIFMMSLLLSALMLIFKESIITQEYTRYRIQKSAVDYKEFMNQAQKKSDHQKLNAEKTSN